jgi:hypothetical protein
LFLLIYIKVGFDLRDENARLTIAMFVSLLPGADIAKTRLSRLCDLQLTSVALVCHAGVRSM